MTPAAAPPAIDLNFVLGVTVFVIVVIAAWAVLRVTPDADEVRYVGVACFRILRPRPIRRDPG
ncbi:MAG TPA: hypothetical protein VD929_10190 [Caulobacteraceae bacterium]|nr:hypothetical protein [Caulobacteraceae bacterium]